MRLQDLIFTGSKTAMGTWPEKKFLIDTVNTHSFVIAQEDASFAEALLSADALIPDGIGIVKGAKWLHLPHAPKEKIAGADLFAYEMERLNTRGGTCFFLGSSQATLDAICAKSATVYPNIHVKTYSPPYKKEFSEEDNQAMIQAVNQADPDLLWIGMTAPKQEKWLHQNWNHLHINCHAGCIGAVFDFFAGTVPRAPEWWQEHDLEWLYRLFKEPSRMWRRIFVSGPIFIVLLIKERFS